MTASLLLAVRREVARIGVLVRVVSPAAICVETRRRRGISQPADASAGLFGLR